MVFTYKDYTLTYGEVPNKPNYYTGSLTKNGKLIGNYRGDISIFQKLEKTLRAKNNPPTPAPCSKRPPFTFDAVVTSHEKFISLFPAGSVFMFEYTFNGRKWCKYLKRYETVTKYLTAEIYDLESHVNTFIDKFGYYGFRYKTVILADNTNIVYIR